MNLENELAVAKEAAFHAGKKILQVYASDDFQVRFKGENDPVGLADMLSNIELCRILHTNFPEYGILTEEKIEEDSMPELYHHLQKPLDEWKSARRAWMIDPLDGTKDFIQKTGDFGIHIGLTEDGQPVLGVNYYPTKGVIYFAVKGEGAHRETKYGSARLSVTNKLDAEDMVIVTSRTSPDYTLRRFIEDQKMSKPLQVGGTGLKMCKVAEGSADLLVVFDAKPSLWDVCSPQVILEEAGGKITDLHGNPINYRPQDTVKLHGGLVATNRSAHGAIVDLVRHYVK